MMARSFSFTVTGSPVAMPQVQAASHRAGQTRLVNSGKLLVCDQPVYGLIPVALIHQIVPLRDQVVQRAAADTMPPSSIPLWQKGTPQSMQRAPWACCSSGVQRHMKFVKVLDAFLGRQFHAGLPLILHKSCRFSHDTLPPYFAFFIA